MPTLFFRAVVPSTIYLLAFVLIACGAAGEPVEPAAAPSPVTGGAPTGGASVASESSAPDHSKASPGGVASAAPTTASAAGAAPAAASAGTSSMPVHSIQAGEIDDNQRWDEYLRYRSQYRGPAVHDVNVSERYVIRVQDAASRGILNALVRVSDGETLIFEGRTYADGRTLFFPGAFSGTANVGTFRVYAEKDGVSETYDMAREQQDQWVVELEAAASFGSTVPLDILFLLDATGSMADEIGQIKSTLASISERINGFPSHPDLRFGMVIYRDRGDEFVTRTYQFEPDVRKFVSAVEEVAADGGGDEPESLNEALHTAVHTPEWRLDDAIRLIFLVADAPPHLDYAQDYDYAKEMAAAHQRGIKIFAIASSGLNEQGEYIFRQVAQHTMGRFIFILYGDGNGGLSTPHDVGQYTVEQLDDLVVRLVEEELAHLGQ